MAKDVVKENFAIINADDFYGDETFQLMAESLASKDQNSCDFTMMAYTLKNTISQHGSVSRGECNISSDGFLQGVTERTHIEKIKGQLMRKGEDAELIPISGEAMVSMIFWGFTPKCFEHVHALFVEFLETHHKSLKTEFYLPNIVNYLLENKLATVEVLRSNAKWFGVTYQEDKPAVEQAIQKLKQNKVYPEILWEDA
jgi:choline kinase